MPIVWNLRSPAVEGAGQRARPCPRYSLNRYLLRRHYASNTLRHVRKAAGQEMILILMESPCKLRRKSNSTNNCLTVMVQDTKTVHGPVELGRLLYGCGLWADAGRIWLVFNLWPQYSNHCVLGHWVQQFLGIWPFVKSETDGTAWQIGTRILKPNCLGL